MRKVTGELPRRNQLVAVVPFSGEFFEKLSDAGRLLSDVHHTLSVSRKELAILNLNKEWKETLIDSPVDEWLFGEDLEERLKAAKSLQFSSKQLKIKSIQLSTGSQTRWTISPRSQQSESQQSGFQQAVQLSVQLPGGISSTGSIQEYEEIPQVLELPVDIKILLKKLVEEVQNQPEADNSEEPPQKIRARCLLCGRAKNRVTTMKCDSCNNFVCKEHSKKYIKCVTCCNVMLADEFFVCLVSSL
ncbi:unnamed protein product [Acanthoscelides obtectus]|uniref:Uncharacterized protein n=1 Tax=Acanthoscelides obtectus TaxID=200917 RepID=A0A9P0K786_ACAOB|nr:unnamed protein product [Acanthoscelides obtectus]CAK1653426.1 hypothetical protein AOBTE_LOCUS18225 [Acanthoscelides obtectus]